MLQKFIPQNKKPAIPKEALEFQPDAEELELTPLPRTIRLTLHLILALFLVLLAWSFFAKPARSSRPAARSSPPARTSACHP